MTDISEFGIENDVLFAEYLIKKLGVAAVPGSSFYQNSQNGTQQIRFCFCKNDDTLQEAGRRLKRLKTSLGS